MINLYQISVSYSENNRGNGKQFSFDTSGIIPLDQFCDFLIKEGIVDDIRYSKVFSLTRETTKALEGKS
jgi:hypothetical protein